MNSFQILFFWAVMTIVLALTAASPADDREGRLWGAWGRGYGWPYAGYPYVGYGYGGYGYGGYGIW